MKVVRRRASWTDVRLFWAVAEVGSFGAAARALNIGLTTVTRAVDRLEGRLNAKLVVRGPQGVTLTHAGALAYDRALTMERMAEQIEHDIADSEKTPEGSVKLASPDGIAGIFLTPLMSEFLRANPKIDLVIDCGLWAERSLGGEADISLTFEEPKNPDVVATPLAHLHYALFASEDYLDLYRAPQSAQESLAHPYIHHVAQHHQRDVWHPRAIALQDLAHKRIETNSSAVSFAAIRHGAGIGPMPTAILSLEPSLIMLNVPPLEPLRLWLTHHRDVARSARIRCVVDWLKDVFDPRTKPWYRAEFVHPREFAAYLDRDASPPAPVAAEDPLRRRRAQAS